jgi:hypothetical protein
MSPTAERPTETFRRFVYHVVQLQARRIVREEDLRSSLNVNFAKGGPLTFTTMNRTRRTFGRTCSISASSVSDREPVFLYRVFNVASARHQRRDHRRARQSEGLVARCVAAGERPARYQ